MSTNQIDVQALKEIALSFMNNKLSEGEDNASISPTTTT